MKASTVEIILAFVALAGVGIAIYLAAKPAPQSNGLNVADIAALVGVLV